MKILQCSKIIFALQSKHKTSLKNETYLLLVLLTPKSSTDFLPRVRGYEFCFIENNNYAFNHLIYIIKRIGSVFTGSQKTSFRISVNNRKFIKYTGVIPILKQHITSYLTLADRRIVLVTYFISYDRN